MGHGIVIVYVLMCFLETLGRPCFLRSKEPDDSDTLRVTLLPCIADTAKGPTNRFRRELHRGCPVRYWCDCDLCSILCLHVPVCFGCFCLLHGIPFWRTLGFWALRGRSSMGGRRPRKMYKYEPGKYNIISSPVPIFRTGGSRREKSIFQVQCKLHIYSTFGVMQRPFVQTLWCDLPFQRGLHVLVNLFWQYSYLFC